MFIVLFFSQCSNFKGLSLAVLTKLVIPWKIWFALPNMCDYIPIMSNLPCHTDIDSGTFSASSVIDNLSNGFINLFFYKSGRFHYSPTLDSLAAILKA